MWAVLCFAFLVAVVSCYPNYQGLIPNGSKVPDPCTNHKWDGVGHYNIRGTGPLNPFGVDFAAEGHKWTYALCMKDSDGDGISNGEELGDPWCTFDPVHSNNVVTPKGHPGICEPVGSVACSSQTFTCS